MLSRLWTKVHDILERCRRPLVVVNALADCLHHVSFGRYRPLKLPLSCEFGPKGVFGSPICRGRGYPQILDMRFQIAVTSEHVAGFG